MSSSELKVVVSVGIVADPEVIARNADRLAAAKALLGKRYLLHPANQVSRKEESRRLAISKKAVHDDTPDGSEDLKHLSAYLKEAG